jgi:UDP-N-acetylmuramyl tripeptide synthase
VQGIEATEVVPGRCEVIDEDQSFGVIIDSASTPKALSRLLDSVRDMGPRRIVLVVGCEGERERDSRPFIGEIAHYKALLLSS